MILQVPPPINLIRPYIWRAYENPWVILNKDGYWTRLFRRGVRLGRANSIPKRWRSANNFKRFKRAKDVEVSPTAVAVNATIPPEREARGCTERWEDTLIARGSVSIFQGLDFHWSIRAWESKGPNSPKCQNFPKKNDQTWRGLWTQPSFHHCHFILT